MIDPNIVSDILIIVSVRAVISRVVVKLGVQTMSRSTPEDSKV